MLLFVWCCCFQIVSPSIKSHAVLPFYTDVAVSADVSCTLMLLCGCLLHTDVAVWMFVAHWCCYVDVCCLHRVKLSKSIRQKSLEEKEVNRGWKVSVNRPHETSPNGKSRNGVRRGSTRRHYTPPRGTDQLGVKNRWRVFLPHHSNSDSPSKLGQWVEPPHRWRTEQGSQP